MSEAAPQLNFKPPHPSAPWAVLWVLFFLLATQVPGGLLVVGLILFQAWKSGNFGGFLDQVQGENFQGSPDYAFILAPGLALSQCLTVIVGIVVLRLTAGKDWPRRIALRWPGWPQVVLTLALFPALVFLGEGMDKLVRPYLPEIIHMEKAVGSFSHWPWWLGVSIIGIGPALGEELWCRGFLGRGLVANHGVIGGVFLTSLLFGIMHVEPRQVVYATAMGMVLHGVYLCTRSLWMPILLHFLNNSLSMLQVSKDGPPLEFLSQLEKAGSNYPLFVYGGAAMLLALGGAALYLSRARLEGIAPGSPPTWTPPFPTVAYPPKEMETRVVYPTPGYLAWVLTLVGLAFFVGGAWLALLLG
ncbi:MAG: CPBP family intramembrane metalloprotease [Gemmataceae bacterium]|nr:CPBP family intramembrane metalloprotease [Gemmataceae bacterium]